MNVFSHFPLFLQLQLTNPLPLLHAAFLWKSLKFFINLSRLDKHQTFTPIVALKYNSSVNISKKHEREESRLFSLFFFWWALLTKVHEKEAFGNSIVTKSVLCGKIIRFLSLDRDSRAFPLKVHPPLYLKLPWYLVLLAKGRRIKSLCPVLYVWYFFAWVKSLNR